MSNTSLLVTRPRHDETTIYLYYWASLIIKSAKGRNFTVYDLTEDKANSSLFKSYVEKNSPRLIFFNGHGTATQIAGHNNEILIEYNKNEQLLTGRVVYALSCSTSKVLGKSCVDKGTIAFIGYSDEYIFVTNAEFTTKPLQDKVAGLFLEPSNLVVMALIKGNTVGEAYNRSKVALIKNLRFALSSQASQEQKEVAEYLWADINIFTVYGNLKASMH